MNNNHPAVSGRLPERALNDVLIRAGFSSNLAKWVESEITTGPYTHYTVSLSKSGSETILQIDTFRLETWIHSKTGQTGVSPHGCCREYVLDANGNVANSGESITEDGEISWCSGDITHYG